MPVLKSISLNQYRPSSSQKHVEAYYCMLKYSNVWMEKTLTLIHQCFQIPLKPSLQMGRCKIVVEFGLRWGRDRFTLRIGEWNVCVSDVQGIAQKHLQEFWGKSEAFVLFVKRDHRGKVSCLLYSMICAFYPTESGRCFWVNGIV